MAEPSARFKPGDVLTADTVNALIEATGITVRTGAGLQSRKGRRGIAITAIPPTPNVGWLAKSTSTFNIASGTTPGSGTLDLYYIDDTGPTATSTGDSVNAYTMVTKAQTSGKAINSGQWCWVEQDIFGTYFAAPLECT
jgi:hypothetical protein